MIKGIISELKKTKWPTGLELIKLSAYTAVLCAIIALFATGLDLIFFRIRDWYLNVNIF
ncbi:preprotein translocase subunit SecE [bacterium]|nr:preprotein translocase subunit SecE [bacterium]